VEPTSHFRAGSAKIKKQEKRPRGRFFGIVGTAQGRSLVLGRATATPASMRPSQMSIRLLQPISVTAFANRVELTAAAM